MAPHGARVDEVRDGAERHPGGPIRPGNRANVQEIEHRVHDSTPDGEPHRPELRWEKQNNVVRTVSGWLRCCFPPLRTIQTCLCVLPLCIENFGGLSFLTESVAFP